jgi:hypothetical protein
MKTFLAKTEFCQAPILISIVTARPTVPKPNTATVDPLSTLAVLKTAPNPIQKQQQKFSLKQYLH